MRGAYNSMMPIYHVILFRYILNDLDMVPVASIATGVTCCTFCKCYISVIKLSLYFTVLVVSFWITFVPPICNVC